MSRGNRKSCEFVTKISRVGHQRRSPAGFFCSCQLLMGAWVPIQEISLFHACSSQSQSQPRNQTMGCVFLGFCPVREREPVSAALTHWALTRGLWRLFHQECPLPAQHSPPPPDSWSAPLQRRAPQENGLVLSKNPHQGREIQLKKAENTA